MKKNNIHPEVRGFTLIELLVAIAIIGVISSLALVNFRRSSNIRRNIASDMKQYATLVDTAKAMSLAQQKFEDQVPAGYGVISGSIGSQEFYLFADADGDGSFNEEEIVETRTLKYTRQEFPQDAFASAGGVIFPIPKAAVVPLLASHSETPKPDKSLEVEFKTLDDDPLTGYVIIYLDTQAVEQGFNE